MAITYFGSKKLMGTKVDRVSDSLGSSGNGNNSGISTTGSHSGGTSGSDDTSGIGADSSNPRGGWGQQIKAGHPLVGTKLKTLTVTTRLSSNIAGRSDKDMTVKVFEGTTSTIRGTSQAISTSTLTTAGTWYDKTFTFTNAVELSADDCICVCIDGDVGTGGGWNAKIKGSPEDTNKGYWVAFQDATNPTGGSIQTNRSMIYTATYELSSKVGTGNYFFDGSNDYVSFGSASNWKFLHDGTSNTVAFWVKRNGTQASSEPCVIDTQGASASKKGISFYWTNNSAGTLTYLVSDGSGSDTKSVVCGDFTDGQWHHVAVTYDGSNITSYKDGTQNAQTSLSGHTPSTADPSYTLHAGRNTRGSTYYKGEIDDIGIYKRALTTTEIGKLVNNNDSWSANDSTNISVSGTELSWNAKRDSSNDACVYDLTSTSANWVLRFKLKVTEVNSTTQAGNGFYVGLSDKDQTAGQSTSQDFIGVSIYNDNQDTFRTIDADGSALPRIYQGDTSRNTTYNTNSVWYYEIVKNGSSYTVNAFSNSDYSTGGEGSITGSSSASGLRYLKVTNDMENISTSTNPFKGTISEIKFYDNQTSATTITKDFTSGMNGNGQSVSTISNKAGLKAHYPMDATTSTVVDDNLSTDSGWVSTVTGNGYDATNDRVNFKLSCPPDSSSHAGGRVIIDVQDADWLDGSNMPDNFTARFKWRVSAMANASQNENRSYMGFFSSDAWGGTSQDSFYIQFWTNTSGIQTFRCECINGGTFQGGSENRVITSLTPSLNTDYYIELKKAGNTHTYRITTNSNYTGGTTATVTQSGIADLRYFGFKSRGDNQANGGNNEGYIDDITITEDGLCPNDASATSDLEVQTNLLANSTFLQIDGTPNYYWKQSDNTWAEDESIPYVWSTNSAKITKRTSSATSGGTQSSFMIAGMREPSSGNTTYADVQKWDGTSWSSGTSKPQATIHASGGGDSNTDHMSAGGYHCCDNAGHNETHEWNGSSWSTSGTLPSAGWGFVGDGNTTTGIMGGNMGYGFGNRCATYNGSSWTNVSDGVGIVGTGTMAGKEASAIHGYQGDCETWDGSAWTTVADLTAGSSGANGGSGGDSSQALFFGGGTLVTDIWNGTTFKAGSNYVSTSAGDKRSCNVDSKGVGLSTWDGGSSAGNGDVFKYSR